jgi:hypothetical protein
MMLSKNYAVRQGRQHERMVDNVEKAKSCR